VGTAFNWQYNLSGGMPYGHVVLEDCISLGTTTSTEDPDKIDANGYALYQNKPNPFDLKTVIEFVLPFAQEATLKFYDVEGKEVEEIKGSYSAGSNQVVVQQKPWMQRSNIVFYRLETEGYTSGMRKMSMVRV
jgi:hypothetical protein